MTLRLAESFDDGMHLLRPSLIAYAGSYTSPSSSYGLTGRGIRLFGSGSFGRYSMGTSVEGIAAFHWRWDTSSFVNRYPLWRLYDSAGLTHLDFDVTEAGAIVVQNNGAGDVAQTADSVLLKNQWHHIQVRVLVDGTNGEVEIRVDGAIVLNVSGIDTLGNSAAAEFGRWQWGGLTGGNYNIYVDDLLLIEVDATTPNTLPGVCKIETLTPDGNGNYSQLTGQDADSTDNYLNVDEAPSLDGDTTYNGSATTGDQDTYDFTTLASTVGTILAVVPAFYVRKTDAAAKSIRTVGRRSSTDFAGSDLVLTETYGILEDVFNQDPVAAAAWTIANVNLTEFGVEVRP